MISDYNALTGCIGILMEGVPIEHNVESLGQDLRTIKGVVEVHDLHVWSISLGKNSMSCHLISTSPQVSLKKARELIEKKYSIAHSTIQVELEGENIRRLCKDQKLH